VNHQSFHFVVDGAVAVAVVVVAAAVVVAVAVVGYHQLVGCKTERNGETKREIFFR